MSEFHIGFLKNAESTENKVNGKFILDYIHEILQDENFYLQFRCGFAIL